MYQEKDTPHYQIMDAFVHQYTVESLEAVAILQIADKKEQRTAIAKTLPHVARLIESQTREDLETNLLVGAIASAVAAAILESRHISQDG